MEGWDIGVKYATGPWGVSVIYYHGERDGGGDALKAEIDTVMGSIAYTLGPGIKFVGYDVNRHRYDQYNCDPEMHNNHLEASPRPFLYGII